MDTNNYINEFVKREKQFEPNPFLSTRILAKVENKVDISVSGVTLWQKLMVVASLAIVIFLGIAIGNIYEPYTMYSDAINISDAYIENFDNYNFDE